MRRWWTLLIVAVVVLEMANLNRKNREISEGSRG